MPRITVEDVGGSFAKFVRNAPKDVRMELAQAVRVSAFGVGQRMRANVPIGPDAPHLKDDVEVKHRGNSLTARVGYFAGGSDSGDQPHVALYNEYTPNAQPFMRPAADDEASEFRSRAIRAMKRSERNLSVGRLL